MDFTLDRDKANHNTMCTGKRQSETDRLASHTYMTKEQDTEWENMDWLRVTGVQSGPGVIEARYCGLWGILNPGMPLPTIRKYKGT